MEALINTAINHLYQFTIGAALLFAVSLTGASLSRVCGRECVPAYGYNVPTMRNKKVTERRYKHWWHNGKLKITFKNKVKTL